MAKATDALRCTLVRPPTNTSAAGLPPYDLVIFDCDGVLVDSEPISAGIWVELMGELGLALTHEETMRELVGFAIADSMARMQGRLGHALPPWFEKEFYGRMLAALRAGVQPIAGVAAALARIDAPVCAASNGTREKMQLTLTTTGLISFFGSHLFCREDVDRPKPAPDLFLYAAAAMKAAPERCAVVEDSTTGVTAAVAAGMRVFGYAPGDTEDALAAAGAVTFGRMGALTGLLSLDG